MPICIAGMHRSGTSMITRLLNLCGLSLGDSNKLLSGFAGQLGENTDGFWEHYDFYSLNERLLISLGAGWDHPDLDEGWEYSDKAIPFIEEAKALLGRMPQETGNAPVWGWKDPRNSITLPFWQNLIPDIKVVICLRNPVEVAQSLQKRNNLSFAASERLWNKYYESLLLHTTTQDRVISHYATYFENPFEEIERLAAWVGLSTNKTILNQAILGSKVELRHHTSDSQALLDFQFSNSTLELYAFLCKEANYDLVLPSSNSSNSALDSTPLQQDGSLVRSFKSVNLRKEIEVLTEQVSSQAKVIADLSNQLNEQNQFLVNQIEKLTHKVQKSSVAIEQSKFQLKRMPDLLEAQKQHTEMISSLMPGIEKAIAVHGAYTKAYRHYDYLVARLEEPLEKARPTWPKWITRNPFISKISSLTRQLKWMGLVLNRQQTLHQLTGELSGTLVHISYMLGQPPLAAKSLLGLEKDFGQKTHLDVPKLMASLRERLAWQNTDTSE